MFVNKIPVISLFSGCGGLDLGFTRSGFEIILALDVNASAVKTYNLNHGGQVCQIADLSKINGQDIFHLIQAGHPGVSPRGVIAGPPCQTFSQGNVYSSEDDRGRNLPIKFAGILKQLNQYYSLDFFVFENVRGITFSRHEKEFSKFRRLFRQAGFILFEGLLDAKYFGVAQKRPRVFVVGLNKLKYGGLPFEFPQAKQGGIVNVAKAIGGLPEPKYFDRNLKRSDIPVHRNHWTMKPKSEKFHDGSLTEGHNGGRSFRVLAWNNPSWTVAYGNREIHIHPSAKRRLSIYEAMRLQGFPKRYELLGTLSEQVKQVCDAVPPPLAAALARSVRQFLKNNGRQPEGRRD